MAYLDTQPVSRANQFSGATTPSTSTSPSTFDFKFGAGLVKMVIDSGGPAFIQFNGNPATTGDYKLTSGDFLTDWYNIGVTVSGVSVHGGTSTALNMRVGAWG